MNDSLRPAVAGLLLAGGLLGGFPGLALAQTYTIVDLGSFGGRSTWAGSIDDSGRVVGDSSTAGGTPFAYLWEDGVMTHLGDLGGGSSSARSIGEGGHVVGQSHVPIPGAVHAFRWRDGALEDLGTLGGRDSFSYGVNDFGHAVGSSWFTSESIIHAFLHDGESMMDLGTLGGPESTALAVNNSGQVVGVSGIDASGTPRGFLYDQGVMISLGTLGGTESHATSINDLGQIVGSSRTVTAEMHACLWNDGELTDLGTLGGRDSQALGINEQGQIVGYSEGLVEGEYRATLWSYGTIVDLNEVVQPASEWKLDIACAINERGQIVATGRLDDERRAFLLTPVDPACRHGNVDTGRGGPPADVILLNGTAGSPQWRRATVAAGVPNTLRVETAPSIGAARAIYALWVFEGEAFECVDVNFQLLGGTVIQLGVANRCLPTANSVEPGICDCSATDAFGLGGPIGITSKALGRGAAARFCVNATPAAPRAPVDLTATFPEGVFTIYGVHQDRNSPNSPLINVSVGNSIVVESLP